MNQLKLIIALLFLMTQAIGQKTDLRLAGLEVEIDSLIKAYKAVGLSIAIVENNQIIYTKGFGYRNLQQKAPVTPNTLFGVGSISKQFTAALIGIYQEQGKLSVKDQLSHHIKDIRFYSEEMNQLITIEDLLAHRSGIGSVDAAQVFFPTDDLQQHLKRLPHLKPNSQVRERFQYSNMGFAILGAIGESITQKTWAENIKLAIFNPLQMNQSNGSLDALTSNNDFSFAYSTSGEKAVKVHYEDQHESVASGAMNSSANDMANWMLMLLNQGKYKGVQVLPKTFIESSFSQHQIISPSFSFDKKEEVVFNNYGYGWFTHYYKGMYRVNHGGSVSGFTGNIELYPHKNLGIVVLTNQDKTNLAYTITNIIANRMLDLERKKWSDYEIRNSQARTFGESIKALNKDKMPSLSLEKYCGTYIHKGYGTIIVTFENGNLNITLPAFKMGLEHHQADTFYTVNLKEHHQNTPSFYYNFQLNKDGDISSISIALQSEPVVFIKM